MTQPDPDFSRRRLRTELRRLRSDGNLTQREVADALDWSPSKIIRIENGSVAVGLTDIRAMLRLYGVDDEDIVVGELVELARSSKRLAFSEYKDVLSAGTIRYLAREQSASVIRVFEPLVLPELLRIEDYARSLFAPEEEVNIVERRVEIQQTRQQIFERPHPTEMFFIIDEAAVRREVGGLQTLRYQIQHLMNLNTRPNVSVQILPFSCGAYPGLGGGFSIVEASAPGDPDITYYNGELTVDDMEASGRLREIFFSLENLALNRQDSDNLLKEAVGTMSSTPVKDPVRAAFPVLPHHFVL